MSKIVIAPNSFNQTIYQYYRQSDPFFDVKVISKEDLLKRCNGKVKEEAHLYLMQRYAYTYEQSKTLLSYLPYIDLHIQYDNNKLQLLQKIKQDLLNHHLYIFSEYSKELFINKQVEIIGYYKEDKIITHLLDKLDVHDYKFVNLQNQAIKKLTLLEFSYEEEEAFYCLNEIASLLKKGIKIDDIYIYCTNEQSLYYLDKYAETFGFSISYKNNEKLYSLNFIGQFEKLAEEYQSFEGIKSYLSEFQEDENILKILSIISEIESFKADFAASFKYFIGKLKETPTYKVKYKNVVQVIDHPILQEGKHIFILDFKNGSFPHVYKDNEYLLDKEKSYLNIISSNQKIDFDIECLRDFLFSNNFIHLSFSSRGFSGLNFQSPLVDQFDISKAIAKLPLTFYSQIYALYTLCKLTDLKYYYRETSSDLLALEKAEDISLDYGSYSNKFTGVSVYDFLSDITLSSSSLDTYYKCPYRYYLSKVLKLDTFEEIFATKVGNFVHGIFEKIYQKDFDFEKIYDAVYQKFDWDPVETLLIENYKPFLKKAILMNLEHKKYLDNPKFLLEHSVSYQISDHCSLKGSIDKAIILNNKNIVLVDYKSTIPNYDCDFYKDGCFLQLPIYSLLIHSEDKYSDLPIIGSYYFQFMYNFKNIDNLEEYPKEFRLDGYTCLDNNLYFKIDNSLTNGEDSSFIKGFKLNKDGSPKKNKKIASLNFFDDAEEIAKQMILEADQKIRNNIFDIYPLEIKGVNKGCEYCAYKDVCHFDNGKTRKVVKEENNND